MEIDLSNIDEVLEYVYSDGRGREIFPPDMIDYLPDRDIMWEKLVKAREDIKYLLEAAVKNNGVKLWR
jgi:hypothetical protein